MKRFAEMLLVGMQERGHTVELWYPQAYFFHLSSSTFLKKWLGYIDQFVVFPNEVSHRIKTCSPDTLFVITDQALGPWISLIAHRPHIVHCHDFLALKSALGEVPENPTPWTGCHYQKMIRRGFSLSKHFISVSKHTQSDLHSFLPHVPQTSEVVYNQVAAVFQPGDPVEAKRQLQEVLSSTTSATVSIMEGYMLHIGANVWYKNKQGVLELYEAWRKLAATPLPLIMIGDLPCPELISWVRSTSWGKDVIFLECLEEALLAKAYAGATALVFPSLDEGFGWPIAEAMAAGCPVVTTNKAPMTEVGGDAAFYMSRRPAEKAEIKNWALEGAKIIEQLVSMTPEQRRLVIKAGLAHVNKFDALAVLDQVEVLYKQVLQQSIDLPVKNKEFKRNINVRHNRTGIL